MTDAVTLPALVGANMERIRKERGIPLDELGQRVERFLGVTWSRQVVWSIQKGHRKFGVADLVALAYVLDCSVPDLLAAEPHQVVEFPTGWRVNGDSLARHLVRGLGDANAETDRAFNSALAVGPGQQLESVTYAEQYRTTVIKAANYAVLGPEAAERMAELRELLDAETDDVGDPMRDHRITFYRDVLDCAEALERERKGDE